MNFINMIKNFYSGMKLFGENIVIIVNSILLLIVYIIGVGFTKIIVLMMRKSLIDTKLSASSYWKPINLKKDLDSFYRQF